MAAIRQKSSIHIAQYGTYDLASLGDTMFPVIFQTEMKKRFGSQVKIDLYSPNAARHPYNHLPAVFAINDLPQKHQNEPYDALVIGGGEFIHFLPIQYLSAEGKNKTYEACVLWKKPKEIAEKLGIPIFWNCVGAGRDFEKDSEIAQIQEVCTALSYLSVRDAYSKFRLNHMAGLNGIHKAPDMLWLMNRHIPAEKLSGHLERLKKEYDFLNQDYLVLQYGTSKDYKNLAVRIHEISEEYHLEVVLLAVNYCHEDQASAEKIQAVCKEFHRISQRLQPEEIMAVISGARFFLGTSLHGNITAMSYGVKNLCLDMYPSMVSKMDGLFEMLQMKELLVSDLTSLKYKFDRQMRSANNRTILEKIPVLQEQLTRHFDTMADLIQNYKTESCSVENRRTVKCSLVKSVLSNGMDSVTCIGSREDGKSFSLNFELQNLSGTFSGIFYYAHPFLLEKIEVFENGKPVESSLQETDNDEINKESLDNDGMLFHNLCRFSFVSKEAVNQVSRIEIHVTLKDAQDDYIHALEQKLREAQQSNLNQQGHIELLLESERKLQREAAERICCMKSLQRSEQELREECSKKQAQLQAYRQAQQELEQRLAGEQEKVQALLESERNLRQELKNKQGHIELLLESEREFERVKKSRTWRAAFMMQQISAAMVPPGSMRRLILKMSLKTARHPVQSLKMLQPVKIRHFIQFLQKEGPASVSRRIDMSMPEIRTEKPELSVDMEQTEKNFEDYAVLKFHNTADPDVSIVIPVYNQFHYTYNCLKSILENTGTAVSYEIIVADDCSEDNTLRLAEAAENIRIIRNERNLLFLKNCNHAAKHARGTYILFLNNDTQVQKNWLEPLVRLMEQDKTIGMTGSKLIYPDGRLQEAGGIIWKDGSAWNYGNRQEADCPEFNYVKEVDYISGASLMIRKNLWETIGGFDERYAPAYCEDTDLSFEVRKLGYKVVYQPLSAVVHFEGISNGTDTGSGIKQYQVENSRKLTQKWADALQDHYPNAQNVFRARERSKGKPMILFIDHYVPQYDQDAGSRTVFQYLRMFVQKGFQVKFIGDNFYRHEPYTTRLEQLGIEVLYGSYYKNHVFKWLDANHSQIDFVFLNRPHISIKYIDYFYNKTKVKIIYYGHDLHFLRNQREYELTGSAAKLREAEEWKKQELYLMEKAAVSYYPSCVEVEEIQKLRVDLPVKAITAYVYDTWLENIKMDFTKREGLLFVGGFVHEPNADAVHWFAAEILPYIRQKYEIPFYIVGSHVPKDIQELHGRDGIVVKGYLPEEELEKLYETCRIAVVPLRYGAGVKGKVIEALYHGVPVVTTSVGAEGIAEAEKIMKIQDEPRAFAEEAVRLYGDIEGLKEMSVNTQTFIKKYFSMDAVWKNIEEDFLTEKM